MPKHYVRQLNCRFCSGHEHGVIEARSCICACFVVSFFGGVVEISEACRQLFHRFGSNTAKIGHLNLEQVLRLKLEQPAAINAMLQLGLLLHDLTIKACC